MVPSLDGDLPAEAVIAVSLLGLAYGSAGMKDEALKVLERLDGFSKDRYVGSLWRGLVWIGLGEKNKALENLEKAYDERESALAFLKIWPILDSVRSEPRFKALLKKMNLEESAENVSPRSPDFQSVALSPLEIVQFVSYQHKIKYHFSTFLALVTKL